MFPQRQTNRNFEEFKDCLIPIVSDTLILGSIGNSSSPNLKRGGSYVEASFVLYLSTVFVFKLYFC